MELLAWVDRLINTVRTSALRTPDLLGYPALIAALTHLTAIVSNMHY